MSTRNTKVLSVLAILVILGVVLGLQIANTSYESEFGRSYDESAHFVTGLMVHDFLRSGSWTSPMDFAEGFYLHYPKVALGHWPPFFYVVQALWYFILPPSRASIIFLIAALACGLAYITGRFCQREFGGAAGIVVSLFLISLPLAQELYSVAMAEMLLASLVMLAALSFGRYMNSTSAKWAVLFSVFAVLAILTKPNGLALALLPPLSLLISRRWDLLRRASFWLPALAVAVICGPWYALTLDMLRNGPLEQAPKLAYTARAMPLFTHKLILALGPGVALLAVIGLIVKYVEITHDESRQHGKWWALAALILSSLLFHWIVPASFEQRHIFIALAPAMPFAWAGLRFLAERWRWSPMKLSRRLLLLGSLVLVIHAFTTWRIPLKLWRGFGDVADTVFSQPQFEDSVVLVVSDSLGEGAFTAEAALRDHRPQHIVLRGSKVLARSMWSGKEYQALFHDPDELLHWLREIPVAVLIIDESPQGIGAPLERQIVLDAITENPEKWRHTESLPLIRKGESHPEAISVFVQLGHQSLPKGPITLDLLEMLGKRITRDSRDATQ